MKKADRPMRTVARHAGGVARHLLRRTRLLAGHLTTPPIAVVEQADVDDGRITLLLPETPAPEVEAARQLTELRARAERAEHAASWLRARLRAERTRHRHPRRSPQPRLDVDALADDLTRELARLYSAHPDVVRRIVRRTLAAHGLPISPAQGERAGTATVEGAAWPRAQQELLAQQVMARAPEVADPAYVYRVVALLAQRGRLTISELTRAAGLNSAMARRRLRLAAEALAALGALTVHGDAFTLNMDYRPSRPGAPSGPQGQAQRGGRAKAHQTNHR